MYGDEQDRCTQFALGWRFHLGSTTLFSLQYTDPQRVYALHDARKDFCADGLHLEVLQARFPTLIDALSTIARYAWSACLLQDCRTGVLENRTFLDIHAGNMRQRQQYELQCCHRIPRPAQHQYLKDTIADIVL
jgi:hypothetical protein